MSYQEQSPYDRGFYEGSRGLPITLYARQEDQNEYERGHVEGVKALAEDTFARIEGSNAAQDAFARR
jgi:hypothetical protein